jgi:polar amino acid transport system permease protein
MSEKKKSAWSPSSREIERRKTRRAINRKQIIIAVLSSILVLGTLALILVTSPGWESVKRTFFDIKYGLWWQKGSGSICN